MDMFWAIFTYKMYRKCSESVSRRRYPNYMKGYLRLHTDSLHFLKKYTFSLHVKCKLDNMTDIEGKF